MINSFLKKCRLLFNRLGSKKRSDNLCTKDFSIISNNCFSGIVYQHFGLEYNTPTIGMYFYPDEYLKFVENFDFYRGLEFKVYKFDEYPSRYKEEIVRDTKQKPLIGVVGDVEIVLLHYTDEKDAVDKWNRRMTRLSNNLIFKFNDQNGCTDEHLTRFNRLHVDNKICFTSKHVDGVDCAIEIKKYNGLQSVKEDYYSCYKCFDLNDYLKRFCKKRVLHLISTSQFSGAENVACQIIKMFSDQNYDCLYCSEKGTNQDSLDGLGIPVLYIEKFTRKYITKAVKFFKPDIIHAHDVRSSVLATLIHTDAKIISHVHANHENMRGLTSKSILFLISAKRFSKIIWVSKSALEGYRFKKKSVIYNKSLVLTNCIDVETVRRLADTSQVDGEFDLIYLGRLNYQKNPERLVEIAKIVADKKKDFKMAIVGTGELEGLIRESILQSNLSGCVKCFGFQINPFPILKKSKIMIMTSRYEGTPMCVLEAMSLGLPVVSTPTDGVKEVVINNDNGWICESDDEIANKVLSILDSQCELLRLNEGALRSSDKINDVNLYKNRIKDCYEQ